MKKLSIQFNSAMSKQDSILIAADDRLAIFKGVLSLEGLDGEFLIGSSPTESASNLSVAINTYNAVTGALGAIAVETSTDTIDVTFLNTSVTNVSAEFLGTTSVITTTITNRDEVDFEYDKQILTRSPHYFNVEADDGNNIESAELHIYIYQGTRYTDRPTIPTYVIRSSAVLANNDKLTFNISEFARSFTSNALDQSGNKTTWSPFVDIFPYYTQNGVAYAKTPSLGIAYNGYGYFEDGYNPQFNGGSLQSNKLVIAKDDSGFRIPVSSELVNRVVLEKDNQTVKIEDITNNITSSTLGITYVGDGVDRGSIEQSASSLGMTGVYNDTATDEFFNEHNITYADTAYLEMLDGSTEVINIRYIQECKFEPIKMTFVNKFGAFQSVWFFKNHSTSMKTKEDSFRRNTTSVRNGAGNFPVDSYRLEDHQTKNLYKSGRQSISLNSGFYPEEYNEVFKQLMLSEDVWITYKDKVLGVNISDSNINFKTSINEKLIEYSIKCDFAFDTINSIN